MQRNAKIIAGSAIVVVALGIGAGVAVAAGSGDDNEGPITGAALEQASAAALADTGGGHVTESEVGDEESYYEVEVTLDDGSQVDVQLDKNFNVVGDKTEAGGEDDNGARRLGIRRRREQDVPWSCEEGRSTPVCAHRPHIQVGISGTDACSGVAMTIATEELTARALDRTTLRPSLHGHPPATPSSFYNGRRRLLVAAGVTFAALAVAAALHGAWLPLRWDLPIQRFVEDHRTNSLDWLFLAVSRLGSTLVVVAATAVLVFLTWSRCRAVSIAIVAAALARPLLEFVLKDIVGRARPDLERMVNGQGYSFPSGHVLAAIALYGLVPVVVGLFTRSRLIWWASAAASGVVIIAIAASRVYLGVHWTTDVLGSLLLGSFFLLGVESVLAYVHCVDDCAVLSHTTTDESAQVHQIFG